MFLTIVNLWFTDGNRLFNLRLQVGYIDVHMSTALTQEDDMRQDAEWMAPSDDRILELIREHGNLTPKAIEHFGGPSRQYASERCSILAEYGLLTRVYRGLYGITEDGGDYLDEQLDASQLEPEV
jgi:hypothetical protein